MWRSCRIRAVAACACIFFALLLSGCGKAPAPSSDRAPVEAVREYVLASSSLDWGRAEELLSGEALAAVQAKKQAAKTRTEVLSQDLSLEALSPGKLAVVSARVEGRTPQGPDVSSYRFWLANEGGTWKIFRAERLPLPAGDLSGKAPEAAGEVVRQYVAAAASGDLLEARKYLAGEALARATPSPEKGPAAEISNLSVEPLGGSEKAAAYLASYRAKAAGKVKEMRLFLHLVLAGGEWKVDRVSVVSEKAI